MSSQDTGDILTRLGIDDDIIATLHNRTLHNRTLDNCTLGETSDGIRHVPRVSANPRSEPARSVRSLVRADRRCRTLGAGRDVAGGIARRAGPLGAGITVDA